MKSIRSLIITILAVLFGVSCGRTGSPLEIYATTDLHGMLLPFGNTEGTATDRSLANLASVVESK